jgi:hypothetical protein
MWKKTTHSYAAFDMFDVAVPESRKIRWSSLEVDRYLFIYQS